MAIRRCYLLIRPRVVGLDELLWQLQRAAGAFEHKTIAEDYTSIFEYIIRTDKGPELRARFAITPRLAEFGHHLGREKLDRFP